mgnify:CR=1 FL=1
MGALDEDYRAWNTPVVGAFLLWRFAWGCQGVIKDGGAGEGRVARSVPLLLMCIVSVILRGKAYFSSVGLIRTLHGYTTRLIDDGKGDKLAAFHRRIKGRLAFTLKSIDIAVDRRLLEWDVGSAGLVPLENAELLKKAKDLRGSVKDLGDKAFRIGRWMSGKTLTEIAFELGVKF